MVFKQDTSGGLFSNYDEVGSMNINNPDAQLFSTLGSLENYRNVFGKFRFKLCYPELTWGINGSTCNEWIQESNPYTDSIITGFEEISLAFNNDGMRDAWRGLGKNLGGAFSDNAAIDDVPEGGGYFSTVGGYTYWDGIKIAGPRHPTSQEGSFSQITMVKLYVIT